MKTSGELLEVFERHGFTVPAYLNDATTPISVFFRRDSDNQEDIEGYSTFAHALESDCPGVRVNHRIRINGTLYNITEVRPDGRGWVTLPLKVQV